MRLLVTRPAEDADALAEKLQAMGHDVVRQPLLSIRFHEDALPGAPEGDTPRVQAFLVTSANGARALGRFAETGGGDFTTAIFDIPVIAVGPASAAAARTAGFAHVHEAGGDVSALADHAAGLCRPGQGPLIHVSGQAVAGDLQGLLEARGFAAGRVVAYEAVAAAAFEPEVEQHLRAGAVDGVLFYSARTARIFRTLAERGRLGAYLAPVTAFCLSGAVAAVLADAGFGCVRVAVLPTEQGMLDLLPVLG